MEKAKKNKVQEILEKSGNGFHTRVVNLLRGPSWKVLVSPYYSDNFTDKPREIDIIAERQFDVREVFDNWLGAISVQLFVECKYVNGDTVFWFDNKDQARAIERVMTDTNTCDHRNLKQQGYHYLDTLPVAKLFSSEKGREENEWMSKAINQNLNALVYYRDKQGVLPKNSHQIEKVLQRMAYPVIVVNSFDNFYKVNMTNPSNEAVKITEPFQLEVNYAYVDDNKNAQNEYFLIDVVSIDTLPAFLTALESRDIATLTDKIIWDKRVRGNQN